MTSTQNVPIHVSQDLRCLKCQVDGAATWEETPAPVVRAPIANIRARNRLRKLVGLTAGFKSVDTGGREGLTIACAGCGARIASS